MFIQRTYRKAMEYLFKGMKMQIRPTNLPKHTKEIFNALNMTI